MKKVVWLCRDDFCCIGCSDYEAYIKKPNREKDFFDGEWENPDVNFYAEYLEKVILKKDRLKPGEGPVAFELKRVRK